MQQSAYASLWHTLNIGHLDGGLNFTLTMMWISPPGRSRSIYLHLNCFPTSVFFFFFGPEIKRSTNEGKCEGCSSSSFYVTVSRSHKFSLGIQGVRTPKMSFESSKQSWTGLTTWPALEGGHKESCCDSLGAEKSWSFWSSAFTDSENSFNSMGRDPRWL